MAEMPKQGFVRKGGWTIGFIVLFAAAMLLGALGVFPGVAQLRDQDLARGLITFIISVSAIGIGFLLVYQAFYAENASDDRFRRGREVFTGLMGVLGTIVGFYFGSADKGASVIQVAPLQSINGRIATHITGGTTPYKISVHTAAHTIVSDRISEDGWVLIDTLPAGGADHLTIDVRDSQGQAVTRTLSWPQSRHSSQPGVLGSPGDNRNTSGAPAGPDARITP